jgi:hypothetical protein
MVNFLFNILHSRFWVIKIKKDITLWNKTLLGYRICIGSYCFKIPIRNKYDVEVDEEIFRLISISSPQEKAQTLTAIFIWLKTCEEVKQFEKEYSNVDKDIVDKLVSTFSPK